MSLSFTEKWKQAIRRNNSLVCVGLDTDPAQLPASVRAKADPVLYFNQQIIDATCDLVCCYKPNFAFYSALGADGFATLKRTLDHIPRTSRCSSTPRSATCVTPPSNTPAPSTRSSAATR